MKEGDYKPVPISAAKAIAEKFEKQQVIIVTWDAVHGLEHVTTYGDTVETCAQAAAGGNKVKAALNWPPERCGAESRAVVKMRKALEKIANWDGDPSDTNAALDLQEIAQKALRK